MTRAVYFTFLHEGGTLDSTREWQILTATASLRRSNATIPVRFCWYGAPPPDIVRMHFDSHRIDYEHCGDYCAAIRDVFPKAAEAIALYPVMHKWLALRSPGFETFEQLLYLDTDTFAFDDVEILMDKFGAHQVYAREEPRSRRSPEGYDASYLDEDVLARLTSHEGLAILPPINLGVVLLNHGSWREIRDRLGSMFDYLWRFSIWLARNPSLTDDPDVQKLRERHGALVERDVAGELPYPSSNRWIREQIAFLLTLGISPPLDLGLLSSTDIWQGCETADPQIMENAVLAHYFSGNLTLFQQWLSTRR